MTKIGPGPPWPISGPPESPIRAQIALLVKFPKISTFMIGDPIILGTQQDWVINNS